MNHVLCMLKGLPICQMHAATDCIT